MCSRVICGTCRKYTWSGCGEHVEDALYGLADDQICKCDSPMNASGFFSRLFGGK